MVFRSLRRFVRVGAVFATVALAACAQIAPVQQGASDFIVVTDFVVSEGAVHLDHSFGFSLNRGEAGVSPERRGASIGRAVGFLVTDTIVERLRALGYDAVSTVDQKPGPSGHRALLVSGRFSAIDEGRRRRVGHEQSAVLAEVQIRAELPSGGTQPVQNFAVDSRTAPPAPPSGGTTRRETGVDADAAKVGAEIARVVAEIARRNNWVPMPR